MEGFETQRIAAVEPPDFSVIRYGPTPRPEQNTNCFMPRRGSAFTPSFPGGKKYSSATFDRLDAATLLASTEVVRSTESLRFHGPIRSQEGARSSIPPVPGEATTAPGASDPFQLIKTWYRVSLRLTPKLTSGKAKLSREKPKPRRRGRCKRTMTMRLSCDSGQTRHLARVLQTMGKVGSEVTLEALPKKMVLRCINTSRTAYLAATFHEGFFEQYSLQDANSVQTGVPIKSFWNVFKNTKVNRISVELRDKSSRMDVVVNCQNGLKKYYGVLCIDAEVLCSALDRKTMPNSLLADAKEFSRLLAHFDNHLDEVTIVAAPEDEARRIGGPTLQLKSFIDPEMNNWENILQTNITMDAKDMLVEFKHTSDEVFEASFNRSDFKAMVVYCELIGAQVRVYYHSPGFPVFVTPETSQGHLPDVHVDAELMLSTQHEPENYEEAPPLPPTQKTQEENFEDAPTLTPSNGTVGNKRKTHSQAHGSKQSKKPLGLDTLDDSNHSTPSLHPSDEEELPATPSEERTGYFE